MNTDYLLIDSEQELSRFCDNLSHGSWIAVDTEFFRRQPERTIIPYYLVDAVVEAPFGSHPGEMCYHYRRDEPRIRDWVEASKDPAATRAYLDEYIYGVKNHQEYLDRVGAERLENLVLGGAQ